MNTDREATRGVLARKKKRLAAVDRLIKMDLDAIRMLTNYARLGLDGVDMGAVDVLWQEVYTDKYVEKLALENRIRELEQELS